MLQDSRRPLLAYFLTSTILTAVAIPAAAHAQVAAPTPPNELEELVVSARRVEESARTVPININVLAGADLDRVQIRIADDLEGRIPTLRLESDPNRGANFQLRGVGRTFQGDPGVVVYVAEVPFQLWGSPELFDMASIEVLKGPQGTLFGRNSTGGAVLLAPKRPGAEFGGFIQGGVGNYGLRQAAAAFDVPASESLRFRLAGRLQTRDGLVENAAGADLDTLDRYILRASVSFDPSPAFSNYTVAEQFFRKEYDAGYGAVRAFGVCPASPIACLYSPPLSTFFRVPSFADVFAQQQALGPKTMMVPNPQKSKTRTHYIFNHTTVDLRSISFKNIIGYSKSRNFIFLDYDGTPLQLYSLTNNAEYEQFSEEFQVRGGEGDAKLKWVAGLFYSKNKDGSVCPTCIVNVIFNDIPPGLGLPPNPRILSQHLTGESRAVYGQATLDLSDAIPGLKATAGGRYTWDRKRFEGTDFSGGLAPANCNNVYRAGPLAGQPLEGTNPLTCVRTLKDRFEAPSWTFSLEYQATPDLFLYGTTRRGYKSGNFNVSGTGTQFISYDPETLTDVEVGAKLQGRVAEAPYRLNISLFAGDYEDIQAIQSRVLNGVHNVFVLNAGEARIRGGELEGLIRPASSLEFSAYLALTDAKYKRFETSVEGENVSLTGKRLPIPRTTASATFRYILPIREDTGEVSLSAIVSYRSKLVSYASGGDPLYRSSPALTRLDLTGEWNGMFGRPLNARLFVRNVTDESEYVSANDARNSLGVANGVLSQPRTYGAELTYDF